ncbi:MAG: hypothetical protein FWD53_03645 [Phycisphaerales bacterium]|nr:hypothetical protein [Phycisphaerales bacterium]
MSKSPSPNGSNGGRDVGGRFTKGNAGGPGNPHAAHVATLRAAMLEAITPKKIKAVVDKLIAQALEGNVMAAKEVLERSIGKTEALDLIERLERLEQAIAIFEKGNQ